VARLLASKLEHDRAAPPVGNESLGFRSRFDDEKLYWIIEIDPASRADDVASAGPPAVISAERLPVN
jgi:hypothetical protein